LRKAIEDTQRWWDACGDWMKVRAKILEHYGHENFTNVTENLAFTFLALLDGAGDFSRSICTAANCGKDTDCTAATVGALLGIMNPDAISEKWLRPIGRSLVLSPEITGISPPDSLDGFTDMVIRLHERLNGEPPVRANTNALPKNMSIQARIGSADVEWFGQCWQAGRSFSLATPKMEAISFPGTAVTLDTSAYAKNALFVEYRFKLHQTTNARVMFNTHEPCQVFLDGEHAFGREEGRMAPSPHRVPIHQSLDVRLEAGEHRLVAVMKKPEPARSIEWVIGISDCDDNDQWIHDPWLD